MITIPIWVFVLLIILASITTIELLLLFIGVIMLIFTPRFHEEYNGCPDEIDPDYNPEYIPKEDK